jgi:plasmid stabilization system protein ParE
MVQFAASADADLDAIVAWYESQSVPQVGRRQVSAIIERVEQLERFPESGTVYRIESADLVSIVRVWRTERLMDPALDANG